MDTYMKGVKLLVWHQLNFSMFGDISSIFSNMRPCHQGVDDNQQPWRYLVYLSRLWDFFGQRFKKYQSFLGLEVLTWQHKMPSRALLSLLCFSLGSNLKLFRVRNLFVIDVKFGEFLYHFGSFENDESDHKKQSFSPLLYNWIQW